jgi:hypothetical protein
MPAGGAQELASAEMGFAFHALAAVNAGEFQKCIHGLRSRSLPVHAKFPAENCHRKIQILADSFYPAFSHEVNEDWKTTTH